MSKYTARRISGINLSGREAASHCNGVIALFQNLMKIAHCTVSKPDENFFEIFFNHL
jgi:hypothetical protein